MQNKLSISAIIPMYNEKDNAPKILDFAVKALSETCEDWEILVVESGSTDGTTEIIKEAASKNPKIVPLFQQKREGMGSALRLGYSRATKSLVWHIESDSPFDLNEIKLVLPYFEKCNAVIGYRTSSKKEFLFGWVYSETDHMGNLIRAIFHFGYNFLIRAIFGLKVKDVNFSFKVLKTELVKRLDLHSNGWFIDAEILIEARKHGAIFKEVGIEYRKRQYGTSTVRLNTPYHMIQELIEYRLKHWKGN
jgi:glycosyltransferase involved in cell wall biosynthesis